MLSWSVYLFYFLSLFYFFSFFLFGNNDCPFFLVYIFNFGIVVLTMYWADSGSWWWYQLCHIAAYLSVHWGMPIQKGCLGSCKSQSFVHLNTWRTQFPKIIINIPVSYKITIFIKHSTKGCFLSSFSIICYSYHFK